MPRTGKDHLGRLRDGRIVYIGNERVDDVTTHPALRNAARTIAALYDMKADPANADAMSFAEAGERYSMYFLQARTAADLRRRTRAHQMIAGSRLTGRGAPTRRNSAIVLQASDCARGFGRELLRAPKSPAQ